MQRFHRQEWLVLHHNFTETMSPSRVYLLGDSQLDNLFQSGQLKNDTPVKNLALPGAQVADLLKLLAIFQRESDPVKVFILIGVNDLRYGRSGEEIMEDYETLSQLLEEIFYNAEVIVLSLLPIVESIDINGSVTNESVRSVNSQIKDWCDRQNFLYLDAYSALAVNDQLPARLTFDGLHLNLEGNRLLARMIRGFFE